MRTALAIVGSDSSGGAGIQTDIKIMTTHGVYAVSAMTALTAQSMTDVAEIMEVTPSFLKEQLGGIFTNILPDAVKVGMVSPGGLIEATGDRLAFYRAANVVVDPIMVSTSGSRLTNSGAIEALKEVLLPMADLLTPSILGAEMLSGIEIHNPGDTETAARAIGEGYGCAVLLRGGHQFDDTNGLLYRNKELEWFKGRWIDNPDTHGTGCTLSSAITSNLAGDMDMDPAVEWAKVYLSGALEARLDLGKGDGPMNYGFAIRGKY